MKIVGFNCVELIVREDQIEEAVKQSVLESSQWFGFSVTLMKRHGS